MCIRDRKDIEKNDGRKININEIELNDKKTFQLISRGDTFGIFQLESPGMKNLLIKMQCNCLDDLIAAIALFRPGPMAVSYTHLYQLKRINEFINYSH